MSKSLTSKQPGKFNKVQRDIDQLKFEIDEFCQDDLPNVGTASPGRMSAYKRACNMQEELNNLGGRLIQLNIADGNVPTKTFNNQKKVEEKRIERLKIQLEEVIEQLEPDEVEEDYFRRFNKQKPTVEPRKSILKSPDNTLEVSSTAKSVKIGNRPSIYDDDRDHVEDEDELKSEDELEDEFDDEDDDEDDEDEEESDREVIHIVQALADFNAEQDGDLPFKKNDCIEIIETSDDGWWTGRDRDGNEGMIPNTLVKIIESMAATKQQSKESLASQQPESTRRKKSGKELWAQLSEPKISQSSITDVLQAMKAVPSGFRSPTLGLWYQKERYSTSSCIIPKTSESNLQLKDLFWDPITKKLRGMNVATCRTISLVSVKYVPPVGAGVEILSRHVYVALWDEEKILSNIHVLRGVPIERDLSWTFTPKVAKNIPSLYDGDIVARIDSSHKNLSLLIELNYSYVRTSTGDRSDICCGWASLPMYDSTGNPISNKNFELPIKGGTPFEKNVPLDASLEVNLNQSLMQSLIRTNRQPRIIVKTTGFNKWTKETLDMLPDTIVTCQKYAPFIGYYRKHAASIFYKDNNSLSGTIFDVIMTQFPRGLEYHDLMDALNMTWNEKLRTNANRSQKKDDVYLLSLFRQAFHESVGGLLQCADMPIFKWADEAAEKARFSFILSFLQKKDPIGNLLSPDYRFKPLNINKMSFTNASTLAVQPPAITRAMSP